MAICVYPLLRRGKAHCVYISSGWAASAGLIPDESTLLFFLSLGCFMLREERERETIFSFFSTTKHSSQNDVSFTHCSLSPFWARIFWICVFILPSGGNNPPGVPPPCVTHTFSVFSFVNFSRALYFVFFFYQCCCWRAKCRHWHQMFSCPCSTDDVGDLFFSLLDWAWLLAHGKSHTVKCAQLISNMIKRTVSEEGTHIDLLILWVVSLSSHFRAHMYQG